jgi:hypothetical protein
MGAESYGLQAERKVLPSTRPSARALEIFMAFATDRIMFEIYRETTYSGRYRVVYFTELNDHNRDTEINRALAGEHVYDGFISSFRKDEAKHIIEAAVAQLNEGKALDPQVLAEALTPYTS